MKVFGLEIDQVTLVTQEGRGFRVDGFRASGRRPLQRDLDSADPVPRMVRRLPAPIVLSFWSRGDCVLD